MSNIQEMLLTTSSTRSARGPLELGAALIEAAPNDLKVLLLGEVKGPMRSGPSMSWCGLIVYREVNPRCGVHPTGEFWTRIEICFSKFSEHMEVMEPVQGKNWSLFDCILG